MFFVKIGLGREMLLEKGFIKEIFPSIQGEGIYVGVYQIFVRFSRCNLRCSYCDTDYSSSPIAHIMGYGGDEYVENPIDSEKAVKIIEKYPANIFHSISITGGEPLLQVDFLEAFLVRIRERLSIPVFLETNGTMPENLKRVISLVDIISMDIKLPYFLNGKSFWDIHKDFMRVGMEKELYVKMVVSQETPLEEVERGGYVVSCVSPLIPLVVQPVWGEEISLEWLGKVIERVCKYVKHVRVIPQMHKFINVF